MGLCPAKPTFPPKSSIKRNKATEFSQGPFGQTSKVPILVNLREVLLVQANTLEFLQQKLEDQTKGLMKKFRRDKSIFLLKKMRLYKNLSEDIQVEIERLENAILGKGVTTDDIQRIIKDAQELVNDLEEIIQLENPAKNKEDRKKIKASFNIMFKRHHIKDTDVYQSFAQIEAEVNEITLTTSSTFKKSDYSTQPSSQNFEE